MTGCLACGQGLHEECDKDPCCCNDEQSKESESTEEETKSRNLKADGEIGVSAGRKRAAAEYKLYPQKPCEWRWKSNCGGGLHPIIGCLSGNQHHRHHGPVKNTARNEETNVHLICERCHNTWHARNDPVYDEQLYETLPHNPRWMTPEDLLKSS